MTDTTDIQALAKRVQYLEDRQAIRDCVDRYSRGIDRHDDDIIASAFHPDAVDSHGSFKGGIEEFIRFANEGHEKSTFSHTHNVTCQSVDIAGDQAHVESYVIFVLRLREGNVVHVGGGRYVDRFEKRDGEWKISLLKLVMDWRFEADGSVMDKRPSQALGTRDKSDLSYMRPFTL